MAVPATLQASLMARLDRLGPAKEVAQIGATIGRAFSHALLSSVVSKPETELASALDRLVQAGLLFRQGVPPHATYLFKHALVQDAAYSTLLRSQRQQMHALIASILEKSEIVEAQPEELARHCSEAGLVEKALGYFLKAGQEAIQRSAMAEAAAHSRKGLEVLSQTPDSTRNWLHDNRSLLRHASLSQTFDEPVGVGEPFRIVGQCAMLGPEFGDGLTCCAFEREILL
jgi:predicted ATPase